MKNASDSTTSVEPVAPIEQCKSTEEGSFPPNGFLGNTEELHNEDVIPLMSYQEKENCESQLNPETSFPEVTVSKNRRTRLLLVKGSLFVTGMVVLILGIVLAFLFQNDVLESTSSCRNDSCVGYACSSSTVSVWSI